nr:YHS domain-containing protein [Candidatus Sigynarchaeota archaeon]
MMKIRDPVCFKEVDPEKIRKTLVYNGDIKYFCSSDCLEQFNAMPIIFMSPNA